MNEDIFQELIAVQKRQQMQLTRLNKADVAINDGSAFPSNPIVGQRFFRSDRGLDYYWNGTYWLTIAEYALPLTDFFFTTTSNTAAGTISIRTDYQHYFTYVSLVSFISTTNDGSNYWTHDIVAANIDFSATTTIYSTSTATDTVNVYTNKNGVATTQNPTNRQYIQHKVTKTNSPGQLYATCQLYYRLIG